MERFKTLEKSVLLSEMVAIENKLDVSFPEDYKTFLLEKNVSIAKEQYLSILIDDLNEKVIFGVMLGVSENQNFSLIGWNSEYQSELPSDSFVFATEYGGGLFVMLLSGEEKGIYFWDHTFIFEESTEDSNVYFLADSFTEFLERLVVSET